MKDREPYSYVVLRYVHDVVSGEFVNVGVVLFAPRNGQLLFRTRKTIKRIKDIFPDLDRNTFVGSMRMVDNGLRALRKSALKSGMFADQETAETYARKVLPKDDSALQWTSCGSGLGRDMEAVLDRLYERHVDRYSVRQQHRKSDDDVWRPVRDGLKERGVELVLQTKTVQGNTDAIEFGRAWKNGCWHAYEPLSMDLADAEGIKDKARKWRGHLDAVAEGVKDKVQLHFILGRPEKKALASAYDNAKLILQGASFEPVIYEEAEVESLVDEIEDSFRAHIGSN